MQPTATEDFQYLEEERSKGNRIVHNQDRKEKALEIAEGLGLQCIRHVDAWLEVEVECWHQERYKHCLKDSR